MAASALKMVEPEIAPALRATVERDALSAALRRCADVFERRVGNIPILGHVRLTADSDGLTVAACDTLRSLKVSISADVAEGGDVCLPGQAIRQIVDGWPKQAQVAIRAEPDGKRCAVSSGRSRYQLASLDPATFPEIGAVSQGAARFDLPGAALSDVIGRLSWAMYDSDVIGHLRGIHCDLHGDTLAFAATDGKALAVFELIRPDRLAALSGIIIPADATAIIGRLAGDAESVALATDGRKLSAFTNGVEFVTRLAEGQFPDYRRSMPPPCETRAATVDRADLIGALARLSSLNDAFFKLSTSERGLTVANHMSQSGDGVEEVEAETAGDIWLSAPRRWFEPALKAFSGEHVTISQAEIGAKIRISGTGDDAGLTVTLMPARA